MRHVTARSDNHCPYLGERAYRGRMHNDRKPDDPTEDDAPLGGDETTEAELDADNAVEQDTLATLDPDAPPA